MPDVLVITGPTATGKTALGVKMALSIGGEIVSADSMQIYKYMDIGTAKPTADEMCGVPHHMMGTVSPFSKYSAAEYVKEASKCVDDILSRGKIPIIVGGTGLYIESLILGRDFAPRMEDESLRRRISEEYDRLGGEEMLTKLKEFDPERALKLHPNDKKRIIRAIEAAASGEVISEHDRISRDKPPRYDARYIVLGFEDRAELYRRIDDRVDEMMAKGLEDEVQSLLKMGLSREHTAMQAIGYKELAAAVCGEMMVSEAVELIKRGSRRYAKRQISWCSRYADSLRINWEKTPDIDEAVHDSTVFWRERM